MSTHENNKKAPRASVQAKDTPSAAKVKSIVAAAQKQGVEGIVFGFQAGNTVFTHIEHMKMKDVSRIAIALFRQCCQFEASNELMSPAYREGMQNLESDFVNMIGAYNQRFEAMATPKEKQTPTS